MAQGTTKGVPIDTDPSLSANSDLLVPSQKAIKTYVDSNASVGHTIQDAGVNETQRTNLNFQRMLVTDDAGNNATVVTRPADTFIGTTAPASPVEGDEWTNSETWNTYKYYDGFWVEISNLNPSSVTGIESGAGFDGMGSVVTVNSICYLRVKANFTITAWSIIAEGTSPTCTIDILKIASGTTLPTASICASALPALSTGNAIKSSLMTGWTTSLNADDLLAFKVTACSNATKIIIQLYS